MSEFLLCNGQLNMISIYESVRFPNTSRSVFCSDKSCSVGLVWLDKVREDIENKFFFLTSFYCPSEWEEPGAT